MTHVNLDVAPEGVRQFLLSVVADPAGAVLETGGQTVAVLMPAPAETCGEVWTDAKNARRCELIERKYSAGLTPSETGELALLQDAFYCHLERVAPLPLDAARQLDQELLQKAAAAPVANST